MRSTVKGNAEMDSCPASGCGNTPGHSSFARNQCRVSQAVIDYDDLGHSIHSGDQNFK